MVLLEEEEYHLQVRVQAGTPTTGGNYPTTTTTMATSELERALALSEINKAEAIEILGGLGKFKIILSPLHDTRRMTF